MNPLRAATGIAIDGGGIKGIIVARALMTLESELGRKPLVSHPAVKILAGTSTGAILSGTLSIGMEAGEIAAMYKALGQQVFPRLTPAWFPAPLKSAAETALAIIRRSLYSNGKLIDILRGTIGERTGNPDFTLADVNARIGPDKALILTVVDVTERRTHFLKSYNPADGGWTLWEAILASASAPPALPVWTRNREKRRSFTDGGVGSYGNPAYVVAREATVFRGYDPSEVSVLSFGTGWLNAENFERAYRAPSTWRGLDWAVNAPNLFSADATRAQSMEILENPETGDIDFRRFQFELREEISAESYQEDSTYAFMERLGDDLGKRIANNEFASEATPQFDPEGIFALRAKVRRAKRLGKD
jgi:predicted acylesterase/phospholipase RssA